MIPLLEEYINSLTVDTISVIALPNESRDAVFVLGVFQVPDDRLMLSVQISTWFASSTKVRQRGLSFGTAPY